MSMTSRRPRPVPVVCAQPAGAAPRDGAMRGQGREPARLKPRDWRAIVSSKLWRRPCWRPFAHLSLHPWARHFARLAAAWAAEPWICRKHLPSNRTVPRPVPAWSPMPSNAMRLRGRMGSRCSFAANHGTAVENVGKIPNPRVVAISATSPRQNRGLCGAAESSSGPRCFRKPLRRSGLSPDRHTLYESAH